MKFVCMGYFDESQMDGLTPSEQLAKADKCFQYKARLREAGNFLGGQALEPSRTAVTLRWKDGGPVVTDGPFAETKEMLGGVLVLEARDMDHAIELMLEHPGLKMGTMELRPATDLSELIDQSEERRAAVK